MNSTRTIELTVGIFITTGIAALFFLAMQVSNLNQLGQSSSYQVTARFDNIGSLKVRAPVSMSGVRVGRVAAIHYDQTHYQAIVTLQIDTAYDRIPTDTFANIFTAGLLGEQYIGLDPGSSEEYLSAGSQIEHTQSALVLEQLIGQFLFNKAGETITP